MPITMNLGLVPALICRFMPLNPVSSFINSSIFTYLHICLADGENFFQVDKRVSIGGFDDVVELKDLQVQLMDDETYLK